jgi:multiple sugar transport system permease protein
LQSVEKITATSGNIARSAPRSTAIRLGEWLDQKSGLVFVMPAVLLILAFSIVPLVISLFVALTHVRLGGTGFRVRFVGLANFEKQLFGSEQYHFLGTFTQMSPLGWIAAAVAFAALVWWLFSYARVAFTPLGFAGRLLTAAFIFGIVLMFSATLLSGNLMGTLAVTLFYVAVGCAIQFLIALVLAGLCAKPIAGKTFFRVLFFVPLTITPAGIGYCFRMLADTGQGPFAPLWKLVGLGDFTWSTSIWASRAIIIAADSWQWIPFIFIVMLAAFENVSRDQIEAAYVDGASDWQIFREISWPQIAPIAAAVMLIRMIEAFKIIDLPNIVTAGGPGIATESMTLHAFYAWRSLNFSQSAAIAYLLLFVAIVTCVSFLNLIVHRTQNGGGHAARAEEA